ncbi:MAG: response regulator transcription factor [Gammaproteobacteria bacterium]|nr:response regulator transcription factor [Gammaproteobacteria bacterium]MBU1554080.1 response regulator transcription factor [Gammaproteobacteria bacterium]MBU2069947.1 response regulator transcription factor [Gammaproteobacteria bacterium]MBU2185092.1 response regulator transcription factor [Gammaproteobacteria bacterium]MBU2206960.1 response regulator transcription factor [Gammaproteobacteria bacterium]
MTAHILLIEDDLELARLVEDFLRHEGFQVTQCGNALTAKKLLLAQAFDLMVCDVMLPGSNGFDLVRQIRQQFKGPILFMTAQTSVAAQLEGLQLGAQDYLLKPLDPRILLAKIRIFLSEQHSAASSGDMLQQGNLLIDQKAGSVSVAGEDINLTGAELQLLICLITNYPVVVSRERLFREQLGREYDGADRTFDGRASRLRRKLQAVDPHWNIRNIWGKGYCISYHNNEAEPA